MAELVLTALGNDRAGLVEALAAAVADHGGNWDRAQMSRLGGKFAGIVLVRVPDERVEDLRAALSALGTEGLLDVEVVTVDDPADTTPASALLTITGADRPGVLREMSHVLASHGVSIEMLDTAAVPAPMAGGEVFEATAMLVVPAGTELADLRTGIEEAVPGFLVEVDPIGG